MVEAERCPRCGRTVTAGSLEGLCARCLLEAATRDDAVEPGLFPSPGQRFDGYRIERLLGKGGMGRVYLARQEGSPEREVAVKVIGAGIFHPKAVERFLDERQILGTLDHPNIARLLDGGITEEGAPYMVMEYVAGVPIDEYCADLPLRRRLELFVAVCGAVHCAHQSLVVHRDIKPANILVTSDGAPKLVDFGIAKMLHNAPSRTATLLRPMTPDYASPEQLAGKPLTTATDVYSLGVVLYELVSGERPFPWRHGGGAETGRTPAKPSSGPRAAALGVSEELDAIVLKALREEPQERYGSAWEMAADVTRYLEGAPVLARRGTFGYLARKLLTRYRSHAAAMGVALSLVAAGVIATGWQAHIANRERARAQRRFEELRGLATSVIFELHDGIARLPGSTEVRKTLVTRALAYLNSLAAESADDPSLLTELAAAYRRVGDVQGRWNHANLGDSAGALASYRKGLAAAKAALAREPDRDAAAHEAGWLDLMIGEIYLVKDSAAEARRSMQQGLDILRARAAGAGAAADKRSDLAAALLDMALAMRRSDAAQSRACLEEAATIYEDIVAAHPEIPDAPYNAAVAHRYLAAADRTAAAPHLKRALELDEMCVKAHPSDPSARLNVALDLAELAVHEFNNGNYEAAVPFDRQSLGIREELAAADPANVLAERRLAYIHAALARDLNGARPSREAATHARKGLEIYSTLAKEHPDDLEAKNRVIWTWRLLGESNRGMGNADAACAAFRRGGQAYESLVQSGSAALWTKAEMDWIARGMTRCPAP